MRMTVNSIGMLRSHNPSIPVQVVFVDTGRPQDAASISKHAFLGFCDQLCAEVLHRPPLKVPGEESYFPIHKLYLAECTADRILSIDTDTFISGDVQEVFDAYEGYEAVACENRWTYLQGFRPEMLHPSGRYRSLNSGVMLWDAGRLREAATGIVRRCRELREGIGPVGGWIARTGNVYSREELAYSMAIAEMGLRSCCFDRRHVHNIQNEADIASYDRSIIFHSYTSQWARVRKVVWQRSRRDSVILRPLRLIRRPFSARH